MKGMIELTSFSTKSLLAMALELIRGDLDAHQLLALERIVEEIARRAGA